MAEFQRLDVKVHRGACDETVVCAIGEMDMGSVEALRIVLVSLVEHGGTVVLDAADVTFCDSSGIHLMVQAHRRARAHGGAFRLAAPPGAVTRVLELAGALSVLEVFPDTVAALCD